MFPSLNPALQQQIDTINNSAATSTETVGRSFLFDFNTGQFILENGKLIDTTKEQALKQWISLCVRTYIDKYNVYKGTGFGTYLDNVRGKKLNTFYKAVISKELKSGLTKNKLIKDVSNINIAKEKDKLYITASIKLADNSILSIGEAV